MGCVLFIVHSCGFCASHVFVFEKKSGGRFKTLCLQAALLSCYNVCTYGDFSYCKI